jgi:peptidoglycan/xylan/chitin deacetylase (PgdA/CDA1 family)
MYHYVRDSGATPFPAIRALSPAQFDQQLDWLAREHTVVTPERFEAALAGKDRLPDGAALLTFDDGFSDHYDTVFPRLRARGWSGVFFVSGDPMRPSPRVLGVHKTHFLLARLGADAFGRAVLEEWGRSAPGSNGGGSVFGADRWEHSDERALKNLLHYDLPIDVAARVLDALFARHLGDEAAFAGGLYLSREQIREMAAGGMRFGYHTRAHRMLSRLTPAEQRDELSDGIETVRALTGQQSVSFCYPWGGAGTYTPDTVSLLDELGYSMAFNTLRRRVAVGSDPRFELPRVDTRDLPPH